MDRQITARIASYAPPDPPQRSAPVEETDELIARIRRQIRDTERQIADAKLAQARQLGDALHAYHASSNGGKA